MDNLPFEKRLYLIAGRNTLEGQSSDVEKLCQCVHYLHRLLRFHKDDIGLDIDDIERIAGELLFKRSSP